MKLSDFNYEYPKELVAQRPLPRRDDSKMMVVDRASKSFSHSDVSNLPSFLKKGDVIVVNDSKVAPARLFGKRANGEEIELLVVELAPGQTTRWRCLLKKAKRIKINEAFFFGMQAKATAKGMDGNFLVVEFKGKALELAFEFHGVPPLPPYIERKGIEAYTEEDRTRYQTVFAKNPGSAAAPTAGLHLSDDLIAKIKNIGAEILHITLHVGIDTFAPVRAETLDGHKMHGERFEIAPDVAEKITLAKKEGHRIIAVGTTTTRALESAVIPSPLVGDLPAGQAGSQGEGVKHGNFTTDLFITPGYKFKVVDVLLTNFHQPKSTLLVLVSAFAGREFILDCYKEAIASNYRLFSYGDCMLIV